MILALDQATNVTGYCIFSLDKRLVNYGIIDISHMPKDGDVAQAEKRYQLLQEVKFLVYKHKISLLIIEGVYGGKENLSTYKKLAQTQSSLTDWAYANGLQSFSWSCAGEWRKIISTNTKNRETDKEAAKQFVLTQYDIKDQVENYIFKKYGVQGKHGHFDDLNKSIKETQFDIYDAICSGFAYLKLIENKG
jgi:Holliday junction resolvasome RuvABC endonuclease subunit